MTPAQTKKYWREWAKVRKILMEMGGFSSSAAAEERHAIHAQALGQAKSSKDLNNRDLDAILDHFSSYLVLIDGPSSAPARADTQPTLRLVWSIEHLGLPDSYVQAIARDQFQTSDWRSLPEADLTRLRFTISARARARKKTR